LTCPKFDNLAMKDGVVKRSARRWRIGTLLSPES
jgi:hypothetical protein